MFYQSSASPGRNHGVPQEAGQPGAVHLRWKWEYKKQHVMLAEILELLLAAGISGQEVMTYHLLAR